MIMQLHTVLIHIYADDKMHLLESHKNVKTLQFKTLLQVYCDALLHDVLYIVLDKIMSKKDGKFVKVVKILNTMIVKLSNIVSQIITHR